jgi:hypothetical protein
LSESGRIIEAIRCWNRALATDSSFVRASGQRGIGFYQYAQYHYDQGHQAMLFRTAYEELQTALETDRLYPGMRKRFQATQKVLTELLTEDALAGELEFDEYPLGDSEAEQEYRRWSLDKRLFLNALNDIGPHSIAAQDILSTSQSPLVERSAC